MKTRHGNARAFGIAARMPITATRMSLAMVVSCWLLPAVAFAQSLTLIETVDRALEAHPALRRYGALDRAAEADIEQAGQRPELRLGVEAENVLGTGSVRDVRGGEFTLSLGSVLERGDKRRARLDLARTRADRLALERESEQLDLMAEATRRFVDLLIAQQAVEIAEQHARAWRGLRDQAEELTRAGAVGRPEADAQTAEAIRAEIDLDRARARLEPARHRLAALWNATPDPAMRAEGEARLPDRVPEFGHLRDLLEQAPELRRLAGEARVREADARLAESMARADLQWALGARRLEGIDEWALMGTLSMPLGSARRARPATDRAAARSDALDWQRQAAEQRLLGALAEAHGQLRMAMSRERRMREELEPALERALESTRDAWRRGAASALQLASLRNELTAARQARLEIVRAGLTALTEIERLTGRRLIATASPDAARETANVE